MHRWWVGFTDKAGSPYSIENPSDYLSPRALERHARLGIAIDSLDLPVNPAYTDALRQTGGMVWTVSRWLNGAILYAADSTGMDSLLRALPFVSEVKYFGTTDLTRTEVNEWYYEFPAEALPFDTLHGPEYYNLSYPNIQPLNGFRMHQAGYEGEGILIGVCDGGFAGVDTVEAFELLRTEGRLVATRDFVYGGDRVYDIHSHGTRVLSTMATNLPGVYVGTAPKASYALCRTEDVHYESPAEEFLWTAGVEYLDSLGADVVNSSLNYYRFDDTTWNYTPDALDGHTAYISRAAYTAATRGILVVVSSGNEGALEAPNIGMPSDGPLALTVGSIDQFGNRSYFSSFGPTADGRLKPDVMAPGDDIWVFNPSGKVQRCSGTSFSCPIMAGMAACLMERHPTLRPAAWCDSIRAWGDRAAQPDNEYGYGTPDFSLALRTRPGAAIDNAGAPGLTLTPNPATDWVEIGGIDITPATQITLYDNSGRALPCPLDGTRLDISSLPRGIYLLRITSHKASHKAKIIRL